MHSYRYMLILVIQYNYFSYIFSVLLNVLTQWAAVNMILFVMMLPPHTPPLLIAETIKPNLG